MGVWKRQLQTCVHVNAAQNTQETVNLGVYQQMDGEGNMRYAYSRALISHEDRKILAVAGTGGQVEGGLGREISGAWKQTPCVLTLRWELTREQRIVEWLPDLGRWWEAELERGRLMETEQ